MCSQTSAKKTFVVHCKKMDYDVYIGRTNKGYHFGNPFRIQEGQTRRQVIQQYHDWLLDPDTSIEPERRQWILDNIHLLSGKVLGCWCKPKECHGDVLIKIIEKQERDLIFLY